MEDLNPEQKQAVCHIEGPLLVLAGAGSGKTRVVTQRIIHLMQLGIPASDILAVTFTNKAAAEMKKRINQLTCQNIYCSTFHSLGAKILRESFSHLGLKSDFTIYDEDDSFKVIKSCFSDLDIKLEKDLLKKVRSKISSHKNSLISPDEVIEEPEIDHKIFTKIYPLYVRKLKNYNAVDFDDLLYLPVKLLQKDEEVRSTYQKRWQFLLIDEYQDTNPAQYHLAKILGDIHKNIFVVGDPDQSIYSWRGANYQNILNFDTDFPGAKIIYLEQNYRSTPNILKAANAVICKNANRYEKNLWSDLKPGEKIKVRCLEDERQEAAFIIDKLIFHHQRDNISLEDAVIFYRTNAQSRSFEDKLLEKNIPYVIIGGLSFYQRKEIKDVLALLKVICSDHDMISFTRTINLPKRGIGLKTISKLHALTDRYDISIIEVCKNLVYSNPYPEFSLSAKQKIALQDYLNGIFSLREMVKEKTPLFEIISKTIDKMRYIDALKEDSETYEDRRANIDELIAKASEQTAMSLPEFLQELTLKSSAEHGDLENALRLMTIHNGKGLEFSLVFISGLEEDLFPHFNCKGNTESLQEERRLFYVGMTRAKKFLYLTHAQFRFLWGMVKFMRASRFLNEIPEEYLEHSIADTSIDNNTSAFYEGDLVIHKDFGKGQIKKTYETSLGTTYDIYFEKDTVLRSLVAKYAKLKPSL